MHRFAISSFAELTLHLSHLARTNLRFIAVLMLVKCIRVGAIRQFALRSVLHQIDNYYKSNQKTVSIYTW